MSIANKVLWAEGLLLSQQHFQQWDKYHTAQRNFFLQTLSPYLTGLRKLIIDEALLSSGQLIIKQCQAVLPNYFIIDYDDRYDPTLSLLIEKPCSIYLSMSLSTHAKDMSGYPTHNTIPAWSAYYENVTDNYDPKREREVGFLKPHLHLLTDDHDRSGFCSLKILEIIQEGAGKFGLSSYIPSVIHIDASAIVSDLLRTQIELLSAKIRLLRGRQGSTTFNQNEITDFFLLQLFNQIFPVLEFYYAHRETPPIHYYFTLIQFLHGVSSFTQPITLPDYYHDDLGKTFLNLDKLFKTLLEAVIPSRMSALKLMRENDVLYFADAIDSRVFEKNSFYLAVYFESENVDWLSQFMRQVKIGARSVIESIVASALPGLRLMHTQRPPNKLAVKSGYEYFYIESTGSFWEQIKIERSIALFTSYEFVRAHIELVTVEE